MTEILQRAALSLQNVFKDLVTRQPSTQAFSSRALDLAQNFITSPTGIPRELILVADLFGDVMTFHAKSSEREQNA